MHVMNIPQMTFGLLNKKTSHLQLCVDVSVFLVCVCVIGGGRGVCFDINREGVNFCV